MRTTPSSEFPQPTSYSLRNPVPLKVLQNYRSWIHPLSNPTSQNLSISGNLVKPYKQLRILSQNLISKSTYGYLSHNWISNY